MRIVKWIPLPVLTVLSVGCMQVDYGIVLEDDLSGTTDLDITIDLDRDDEGDTVEMRDICPKNDSTDAPVEHIPEEDCWTLGPYEFRISRSQVAYRGAPPRRIELRSLFTTRMAPAADG